MSAYRGRLAPTTSGLLHLGHARAFAIAWQRCREQGGVLIYRDEDLDPHRCLPEFATAARRELEWLGLRADFYARPQSSRMGLYRTLWRQLLEAGLIYPCERSRRELRDYAAAHPVLEADNPDAEPVYPQSWRPAWRHYHTIKEPGPVNWRFRVPWGRCLCFHDGACGPQAATAGRDFGDFLVWRKDGVPSYELAVVADDLAMGITEVVRGADLLVSTARQQLLYQALEARAPRFFHLSLLCDREGRRLSKRGGALGLAQMRAQGMSAQEVLAAAGVGELHGDLGLPCASIVR